MNIRGIGVEPQQNPNLGEPEQPQGPGVKFDLLHPQQTSEPIPPAPIAAPIAPPPPIAPLPAPVVPAPVVEKVGTTQQPNLAPAAVKSGGRGKLVAIILAVLVLLGGGAAAAYFYFFNKTAAPAPSANVAVTPGSVTNLTQSSSDGVLQPGAVSKSPKITFDFDFATSANAGNVVPEVEIQPLATQFTDQPTVTGTAVAANGHTLHLTATSAALTDGQYHWQARMRVGAANGPWVAYDSTTFSFGISGGGVTALTAPVVETVGGTKVVSGKVSVAASKPAFAGTTTAGAAITVTVKPEGLTYTATAASSGAWTVTPSDDLPNGNHTVTVAAKTTDGQTASTDIALAVNPVAVTATPAPTPAPAASATPTPVAVADVTPSPQPSATLAPTGDPVVPISLLAFAILAASLLGLRFIRHEG